MILMLQLLIWTIVQCDIYRLLYDSRQYTRRSKQQKHDSDDRLSQPIITFHPLLILCRNHVQKCLQIEILVLGIPYDYESMLAMLNHVLNIQFLSSWLESRRYKDEGSRWTLEQANVLSPPSVCLLGGRLFFVYSAFAFSIKSSLCLYSLSTAASFAAVEREAW